MAVGLAAAAPLAQAQEPPDHARTTTLYLHAIDHQDMPMSTQAPAGSFADDVSLGVAPSLSCLPNPPAAGSLFRSAHTWRGYGFQGHVDYNEATPRPMFPGGYGPAVEGLDVNLTGGPMTLHWSWSTDVAGPVPLGAPPLANVVVEATLRTGQAISVDGTSFDAGDLIAHGRSESAILAGEQSVGASYARVGDRGVYDFTVDLDVERSADGGPPRLPAVDGFNLRVDTYILRDQCPADGYLMPGTIALHTSAEHRPRLEFTALDAPRVLGVHAGPLPGAPPGRVVVFAELASPWGDHDLAQVSLAVRSLDDPEAHAGSVLAVEPAPSFHCHCPATPVERRWVWDAEADGAPPGRYVATVTATSLQGEVTTYEQEFSLSGEKAAPAASTGALVIAVAFLAVMVRRRS